MMRVTAVNKPWFFMARRSPSKTIELYENPNQRYNNIVNAL